MKLSMEQAGRLATAQCFGMAAAQVMREYDQPGIAYSLMRGSGITTRTEIRKLKLQRFDTEMLYKVLKSEGKS